LGPGASTEEQAMVTLLMPWVIWWGRSEALGRVL